MEVAGMEVERDKEATKVDKAGRPRKGMGLVACNSKGNKQLRLYADALEKIDVNTVGFVTYVEKQGENKVVVVVPLSRNFGGAQDDTTIDIELINLNQSDMRKINSSKILKALDIPEGENMEMVGEWFEKGQYFEFKKKRNNEKTDSVDSVSK